MHANDDPFIRVLPETREKLLHNPHITYVETLHGGHCAFLAEANGYDGRWPSAKPLPSSSARSVANPSVFSPLDDGRSMRCQFLSDLEFRTAHSPAR